MSPLKITIAHRSNTSDKVIDLNIDPIGLLTAKYSQIFQEYFQILKITCIQKFSELVGILTCLKYSHVYFKSLTTISIKSKMS